MDLKKLKNIKLTQKQQNQLIGGILIIGLSGFGYYKYLLTPLVAKETAKKAILEAKQKDLKDAKQMVLKYPEFLRKASTINRKIDFINRRLPTELNFSDTVRELSRAATESKIKMTSFVPSKNKKMPGYEETSIKMKAKTNFNNLGNFLTNIGYIERLITSHEVKIISDKAAESADETLMVDMVLKVYSSDK